MAVTPHQPDYTRIERAARNEASATLPLYEHAVSPVVLSELVSRDLPAMLAGDAADVREALRVQATYLASLGYDVFAFEGCITELVQGGEALMGRAGALFTSLREIRAYDWDALPDTYFARFAPAFEALREVLPPGMKAVAGVGNGVFEIAQDFVPLTELAYLQVDDPEAFAELWRRVGDLMFAIWTRFLDGYGDSFCVCRIGDDLGFKTSLLMQPEVVREHVIPQYARIVSLVHDHGKPFLLHSCGAIQEVMEDIIAAGIDAKHSNEDAIAPFSFWVDTYGDRIGNFGGIDMNVLCTEDERGIRDYITDVLEQCVGHPGIAIGSGNQIADYVPPEAFLTMVRTVREFNESR